MTKIKICGLFRECDIAAVNEARPDYAGFIINFSRSHRNLSPADAATLRKLLDPSVKAVGVFVNRPLEEVADAAELIGLDIIQLHGDEDDDYIDKIRDLTKRPVWKAFKIRNGSDIKAAALSRADEVLLDNGYGTGEAFEWSVVTGIERPFILAGGLAPDNIERAIKMLKPDVVDVSSGVETEKLKDADKILRCVNTVRTCSGAATD